MADEGSSARRDAVLAEFQRLYGDTLVRTARRRLGSGFAIGFIGDDDLRQVLPQLTNHHVERLAKLLEMP